MISSLYWHANHPTRIWWFRWRSRYPWTWHVRYIRQQHQDDHHILIFRHSHIILDLLLHPSIPSCVSCMPSCLSDLLLLLSLCLSLVSLPHPFCCVARLCQGEERCESVSRSLFKRSKKINLKTVLMMKRELHDGRMNLIIRKECKFQRVKSGREIKRLWGPLSSHATPWNPAPDSSIGKKSVCRETLSPEHIMSWIEWW